jgi:hypothetical protein
MQLAMWVKFGMDMKMIINMKFQTFHTPSFIGAVT